MCSRTHAWCCPQKASPKWDCCFTQDVRWHKDEAGRQTVNQYALLGELGKGSYGRVQLCERRVGPPPWRRFAMKIMSRARLRKQCEYANTSEGGMRKVTAEEKVRRESCPYGLGNSRRRKSSWDWATLVQGRRT